MSLRLCRSLAGVMPFAAAARSNVGMRIIVAADGCPGAGDELRDLRSWLVADDDLMGRVHPVEAPVAPGHLGPVIEALSVVLTSVSGPLATLIIGWLRHRRNEITLTFTRPDGTSITLEASRYRNLTPDELAKLTEELVQRFEDLERGPEDGPDGRPRRG